MNIKELHIINTFIIGFSMIAFSFYFSIFFSFPFFVWFMFLILSFKEVNIDNVYFKSSSVISIFTFLLPIVFMIFLFSGLFPASNMGGAVFIFIILIIITSFLFILNNGSRSPYFRNFLTDNSFVLIHVFLMVFLFFLAGAFALETYFDFFFFFFSVGFSLSFLVFLVGYFNNLKS